MSNLFDTPLTVQAPPDKWTLAITASVQLAKMVLKGYFFGPFNIDFSASDRMAALSVAREITDEFIKDHPKWHEHADNIVWREAMLMDLEGHEGHEGQLRRVSLHRRSPRVAQG